MSALAAEAKRLLRDAQFRGVNPPTYPSDSDTIAAAQAVATLALVEQVRIANLAAIANLNPFIELDEAGESLESVFVERVDAQEFGHASRLRPEIAAALDINQKGSTHEHGN